MAGDLLLQNLTYNQRSTLIEAGGVQTMSIFHSDKVWDKGLGLSTFLKSGSASRVGLPPHSYITFERELSATYRTDKMLRLRLDDLLRKATRPAFVSVKASLAGWPGVGPLSAVLILEAALPLGKIIIEFYTMDDTKLHQVFPTWQMVPE